MQKSAQREPVIGILGGMGPEATVELMARIVKRTPARDDVDHIHMLVDNNPKIPSRIAFLLEGGTIDPVPTLVRMAQGLERQGATHLVMPCNTAHAFVAEIRAAIQIPFIDMLDLTIARISAESPRGDVKEVKRIGVLGSPALRLTANVDKRCVGGIIEPVYADEAGERLALSVIRRIKAGDTEASTQGDYAAIKSHLIDRGADRMMVCCTEFSVLEPSARECGVPVMDTMDVLVDEVLAVCGVVSAGRRW